MHVGGLLIAILSKNCTHLEENIEQMIDDSSLEGELNAGGGEIAVVRPAMHNDG